LKHVRTSHLLDREAFDFDRLPPSRGERSNAPQGTE